MSDKAIIIGGAAGVVTVSSIAAYFLSKPHAEKSPGGQTLSAITLSASSTSIQTGGQVTFTALATDTNNNPFSGASLTLFDKSTSSSSTMGSTNSQGQATISLSFNDAGTFVMYAESASGIKSNNVSIVVSSPSPVLTTIKLAANHTSISPGDTVSFTATAYNQNGGTMSGVSLSWIEAGSNVGGGITNSSGVLTYSPSFPNTGTYAVYVTGSGIKSNTINITVLAVSPPPPPPSYTCYVPKCERLTVNGHVEYFCVTTTYTQSTPCPSNASSPSAACATITCG